METVGGGRERQRERSIVNINNNFISGSRKMGCVLAIVLLDPNTNSPVRRVLVACASTVKQHLTLVPTKANKTINNRYVRTIHRAGKSMLHHRDRDVIENCEIHSWVSRERSHLAPGTQPEPDRIKTFTKDSSNQLDMTSICWLQISLATALCLETPSSQEESTSSKTHCSFKSIVALRQTGNAICTFEMHRQTTPGVC